MNASAYIPVVGVDVPRPGERGRGVPVGGALEAGVLALTDHDSVSHPHTFGGVCGRRRAQGGGESKSGDEH